MSLFPLDWVVINSPPNLLSNRMNGSAARVLWVSEDGWIAAQYRAGHFAAAIAA